MTMFSHEPVVLDCSFLRHWGRAASIDQCQFTSVIVVLTFIFYESEFDRLATMLLPHLPLAAGHFLAAKTARLGYAAFFEQSFDHAFKLLSFVLVILSHSFGQESGKVGMARFGNLGLLSRPQAGRFLPFAEFRTMVAEMRFASVSTVVPSEWEMGPVVMMVTSGSPTSVMMPTVVGPVLKFAAGFFARQVLLRT